MSNVIFVIIGPSGSGKTVLAKWLEKKHLRQAISYTTRPKRKGEKNGKDYYFVTREEFKDMIYNNKLIEHAIYNNNYYGLSYEELEKSDIVTVEPQGLKNLKRIYNGNKKLYALMLVADRNTLKNRMLQRGDPIEKVVKRLTNDIVPFSEVYELCDIHINNSHMPKKMCFELSYEIIMMFKDFFDGPKVSLWKKLLKFIQRIMKLTK